MREQGKIRHIGLSEVSPAQIEEAQKIVPIVTVQNRYSLADRQHEATVAWCEQRGIGFLPWYPMTAGKVLKPDHPSAQALAHIAARHSASVPQILLAWLLRRSPVMLPIPGTSRPEHLEENWAARSVRLTPDEVRTIAAEARAGDR
jgi:aryl-alcohol dehydrogenase-like predicted oxidoreductase